MLTRGNTLRPTVLLLGGPNTYIKGMRDCWKFNIPKVWEERKFPLPEGNDPEELVQVPENAQYFAAIGWVDLAWTKTRTWASTQGTEKLEWYINVGRLEEKKKKGGGGPLQERRRACRLQGSLQAQEVCPPHFPARAARAQAFMGIDGGSTSTKAVLVGEQGEVMVKCYQLSKGNPIEDTKDMFANLRKQVESQGATLELLGVGIHRLRQGHSEGRAERRRGHRRNRGAHRGGAALLSRGRRHLRRGRAGHQAHHPAGRPRQRLQAEHAMLRRQRLLPAIDLRGFRLRREGVRRSGVSAPKPCRCSATAARSSCSPTSSISSGRAGSRKKLWRDWRTFCPRTSGSTCRRFPTWHPWATPSSCREARSTTWRPSRRRWISSSRASRTRASSPMSSCTSTAANPAPSARRWRRVGCTSSGHADPVHRPGCGAENHLRHPPQRGYPLLLLQEQVHAHVHRRAASAERR